MFLCTLTTFSERLLNCILRVAWIGSMGGGKEKESVEIPSSRIECSVPKIRQLNEVNP